MIDCLPFVRTDETGRAFALIKKKLTNAPILAFTNFENVFELECDLARWAIRAILSQGKRYITCLSKKLNKA